MTFRPGLRSQVSGSIQAPKVPAFPKLTPASWCVVALKRPHGGSSTTWWRVHTSRNSHREPEHTSRHEQHVTLLASATRSEVQKKIPPSVNEQTRRLILKKKNPNKVEIFFSKTSSCLCTTVRPTFPSEPRCAPAQVLGFGGQLRLDCWCIFPPTAGDAYQTLVCNLDAIQQLCRLPPERGCQNQLASAWDVLFTVSVRWHRKSLSSISTESPPLM